MFVTNVENFYRLPNGDRTSFLKVDPHSTRREKRVGAEMKKA